MNSTGQEGPPTSQQGSHFSAPPPPRRSARPVFWLIGTVAFLVALLAIRSCISRVSTNREINQLIASGHGEQAVVNLQQQIQSSPNDANLYFLLGKAFLAIGNLMQAQEAFNRTVSLDSSQTGKIAQLCFDQGKSAFESSNSGNAGQLLAMAAKFDPSVAPKIAQLFYAKGKAAFQLHDMNSAEQLFGRAIQFDPSLKATIAGDFADAAIEALDFKDFDGAERYAKEAVSYDPDTARKQGQALFDKLTKSLCNLHALGKQRFMVMMKLCGDLGLPDATRETVPYRFAYALELYENGPRQQGIDIMRDIASSSSKSCEGQEANYILSPPPPGRMTITGMPPVTAANGNLTDQLLYVDVSADGIRLTFSMHAGDNPADITYARLGPRTDQSQLLYILDDNGTKLNTTTGWVGGRQGRVCCYAEQIHLAAGEQAEVYADFPLPTAGSNAFKFVEPQWVGLNWPETKIKRDLFE